VRLKRLTPPTDEDLETITPVDCAAFATVQILFSIRGCAKEIGVPEIHLRRLLKAGLIRPDAMSDSETLFTPEGVEKIRLLVVPKLNFSIQQ
jgi:hypothetical protein